MKRQHLLSLLSLWLILVLGTFAFHQIRHHYHRRSVMDVRANHAQAYRLKFSDPKDIIWIDKGSELRYENKIFDVLSLEVTDSTVIVYCLFDKEDSDISPSLLHRRRPFRKSRDKSIKKKKILSSESANRRKVYESFKHRYPDFPNRLQTIFGEIPTPPPQAGKLS
ncbi:MAG: hypothetical protein KDC80_16570 [Saprospiraceae bacterium]|nr:hypothetical protein [Saprospiraceae bacterium]